MFATPNPFPRRPSKDPYRQPKSVAKSWAFVLDPGSSENVERADVRALFSETLAAPARPVRDRWYAGWRAAADAVAANDLVGVIVALTGEVTVAFHELDGLARRWRTAAAALAPPFGARPPRPRTPARPASAPPDRESVRKWLTDLEEFCGWARAVAAAVTLPGLVRHLEREFVAAVVSPEEFARTVLDLIVRRGDTAEYAAAFDAAGGPQRLARFTAIAAGVVVPPPLGYEFREQEFPDRGRVRGARSLLTQAAPFIERCHTHDFLRRYLPEPAAAAPPPAGRIGTARPLASGNAAAPHPGPPPPVPTATAAPPLPPPVGPPAWVTRHFRGHQQKLLLALWGKGAVPIAVLYKAVGYSDRERLRRRISAVGSGLMQKRDLIGGRWVIEKVIDGDEPSFFLRQLSGMSADGASSRPDPTHGSR